MNNDIAAGKVARIKALGGCQITAMCDVNNPLYGLQGAAYVFGAQKGADEKMIEVLDRNLLNLSEIAKRDLKIDLAGLPGAGAAGGMGAGAVAFLGAELKPGIEIVLDAVGFDRLLAEADLVITGEGRIDGQSLRGKTVFGVAGRAKEKNVPVIAVVGDIGNNITTNVYNTGVTAVISINRVAIPFDQARLRCENDMSLTMDTLMRLLKLSAGRPALSQL